MSSDNQFTALGPTIVGFQTHGANIEIGAECFGTNVGIRAKGTNEGINVESEKGNAIEALSINGKAGVYSRAFAQSAAGVYGIAGNTGTGVTGQGLGTGIGVWGISEHSRGGLFTSKSKGVAQIHLNPHETEKMPERSQHVPDIYNLDDVREVLPNQGLPGDLIMMRSIEPRTCSLWLCIASNDGQEAVWAEVLLGPSISGLKSPERIQIFDQGDHSGSAGNPAYE